MRWLAALIVLIAFAVPSHGLGVRGDTMAPNKLSGESMTGHSLSSWGKVGWETCDFGGDLPTPYTTYSFHSDTWRNSGIWKLVADTMGGSPVGNYEAGCAVVTSTPHCGIAYDTGGPNDAPWVDLADTTYGTAHRGFVKSQNVTGDDWSITNEFTLSIFLKLDSHGLATYLFSRFQTLQVSGLLFADSHLCMDVFSNHATDPISDGGVACGAGGTQFYDHNPWPSGGVSDYGSWHSIMVVFDGATDDTYKMYFDGVLVHTVSSVTGTVGFFSTLEFGAANTWGVDGGIANVSLFDEALDAGDALAMATCLVPQG